MSRSRASVLLVCLAACAFHVQAQTAPTSAVSSAGRMAAVKTMRESGLTELPFPAEIPDTLLDETLALVFFAVAPGQAPGETWEAKELRYTIPGTPVSVRMVGSEAVIVVSVTPYRGTGDQLVLVAQGQVWYKEGSENLRYRTTFDTIALSYAEQIFFYPFGVREDGSAPLRVELLVDSYRLLAAAWAAGQPAAAAGSGTGGPQAAGSVGGATSAGNSETGSPKP